MRLSISNLAWDKQEDHEVLQVLNKFKIDAIDVAPGKYFSDFKTAQRDEIHGVRQWWNDRGIEITGMQALLFGTHGLNVFGTEAVQNRLLDHLTEVCRIGAEMGATRLVFGSPKNRDRTGFSNEESMVIAVDFFRRLGDIAKSFEVLICLEPNPPCYGANFMTTTEETALVVSRVGHENIKMQFDTGALFINGEDPIQLLASYSELIGHIHASEPNLVPLGDTDSDHRAVAGSIRKFLPHHLIAIEMLATQNEPHAVSIERALKVAVEQYGNTPLPTRTAFQ